MGWVFQDVLSGVGWIGRLYGISGTKEARIVFSSLRRGSKEREKRETFGAGRYARK